MKIMGIILLFLILLLGLPVASVFMGYSALIGMSLGAGILGAFLLVVLVHFLWGRRRERNFVNGLVAEGGAEPSIDEKEIDKAQRKQWKTALSELKKSHLRVKGDPLYVLPWYMLLGETGTGKSTAIENSGLSTNLPQPPRVSGVSGTRHCEWWFFNEAIVLDTAGRYATHQDEPLDKREWHSFLGQLPRYRKKEPLNGLVVTVSAKTLLTASRGEIESEGLKIRERIDELMQVLGAKFPIYLLVTKCDLIQGMTRFCDLLPETAYEQVFGCLNVDTPCDAPDFLNASFAQVTQKLRSYRRQITRSLDAVGSAPVFLFFPEEFQTMEPGLSAFAQAAFSSNVYQEPPFFRGVFFSSARQSGSPVSHFPEAQPFLENEQSEGLQEATDKSYFLHDLFSKILPADRHLHVPTRRFIDGKTRMFGLAFSCLILACLTFGGLLSYSFSVNLSLIREVQREYVTYAALGGDLVEDVTTLERLRQLIKKVEKRNQRRWVPDFGLGHCVRLERELKRLYCEKFQGEFMASYDTKMGDSVVYFSEETPEEELGGVILHYIRRINLITQRVNGGGFSELMNHPQPDYDVLMISPGHQSLPSALEIVQIQYCDYLIWASRKMLIGERGMLSSWLSYVMKNEKISLAWLVTWCNSHGGGTVLTLEQFWEGSLQLKDEPVVNPAFTLQGVDQITGLIGDLEHALENPLDIAKKKEAFLKGYKETYAKEWYAFASFFPRGKETIKGREQGLSTTVRMGTSENPYFMLLEKMARELSFIRDDVEETPLWMTPIFEFQEIRHYASTATQRQDARHAGIPGKGGRFLSRVKKYAGSVRPVGKDVSESVMICAEAFTQYTAGISGISKASLSIGGSFALAGIVFSEDPVTGKSPVRLATSSEETMKIAMENHRAARALFCTLFHGPFDYLWDRICTNTGVHLQEVWDETVLSEINGIYDKKTMSNALFGKSGCVSKYIAGPARPFIGKKRRKGYYAKKAVGKVIPFKKSLFTYVTRGTYGNKSEKTEFKVTIEGLPTDINSDANIQPHMTTLKLDSVDKTQVLVNRNYQVKETFQWSSREGGDVTLKIGVGDLVLEKKYTGNWAFAKFIKAFSHGQHEFHVKDFPESEATLKRMGVRYIRVNYKMTGTRPILRMMYNVAGKPPEVIIACLD
ncbi:type VI secretion protein IcmF/TssM N-terminal domain-containing protein [Desulfoluna sp.]|uniref:type VI secretion protein IcmF/TssM N-terminal domain-containing protein n=1 Tax=Desulfoluna sp. TaxID=2045199 RepID=UPI00262BF75B|nr:type VI secretion protein IcmF/TssM N-terminal domain-containing protein [Desulfoluna sp.]